MEKRIPLNAGSGLQTPPVQIIPPTCFMNPSVNLCCLKVNEENAV